jgi:UrcA family protein
MKSVILSAAITAAAISVLNISTADARDTGKPAAQERVSYADLDLVSVADQARLERRIRSAAHRLCLGNVSANPTAYHDIKCFKQTVAGALSQMELAVAAARNRSTLASAAIRNRKERGK